MAVTKEFVDAIGFEIVKQKYYNANKVNSSLEEIKAALYELIEENEALKNTSAEVEAAQAEIGDVLLSSKQLAAATVSNANIEADKIVADARQEAFDIINGAEKIMNAAREEAARIQEKAAAIDAHAEKVLSTANDVSENLAVKSLTDEQIDTVDDLIAQLDELSVTHSTKILKMKQILMTMVTEN